MKALLNYTDYTLLNERLSNAKGYPKGGTHRVWSMNPKLAELNGDVVCVANISSNNLEQYPEIFEGLNLVNDWEVVPYEGELELFELHGLTTEQIDWVFENINEQFTFKDGQMLIVGDQQPSSLEIVEKLVDKGLNIGIYEEN